MKNEVKCTTRLPLLCTVAFVILAISEIEAQWIPSAMSEARYALTGTAVGNKAFFAGGDNDNKIFSTVDIYDATTNTWTTDSLSEPRVDLSSASLGTKVFFAGGFSESKYSSVVDIYDVSNGTWTKANLSQGRADLAATSVGTKVFFAGGTTTGIEPSNVVDIYDASSDTWTVHHLSVGRFKLAAISLGSKVFFAGGMGSKRVAVTDVIDVYDNETGTWTVHHLSKERFDLAAATVGDKVFFAGGISNQNETDVIDIYDISTGTWGFHRLSKARGDLAATTVGNKVFFAGGYSFSDVISSNVVDIYDHNTNTWSTAVLSEARNSLAAVSVGTKALFAGGWAKIHDGPQSLVDIYETGNSGDSEPPEIVITYKNNGAVKANGKKEIEIHVTDASRISYVRINGILKVEQAPAKSLTFLEEFFPGDEVQVRAADNFNLVADKSFIVRGQASTQLDESATKPKRKYYALLMAVEEYQDDQITPLNEPIRDATLLKNLLVKYYTFDGDNVNLLKNPTLDEINIAFESLNDKVTSEDLVLIFFAGHGYFDEKTNIGYWLPADANEKSKTRWFRNSALVENIRAINSKHTLLVADACFSGAIFKTRGSYNNANPDIANMLRRNSRKALTSGSLSTVPDKSLFMEHLLRTLEQNPNRYLPSEDLYDEIRRAMKNRSSNKPAYGEIQNTGDAGGNFVFIRKEE